MMEVKVTTFDVLKAWHWGMNGIYVTDLTWRLARGSKPWSQPNVNGAIIVSN